MLKVISQNFTVTEKRVVCNINVIRKTTVFQLVLIIIEIIMSKISQEKNKISYLKKKKSFLTFCTHGV